MWTSVTIAIGLMSLAPVQADKLKISNARFTYSGLGMERTNTKFLPGDYLVMSFDIDNFAVDKKSGKVVYSLLLEYIDKRDKAIFKQDNESIEELNAFGGTRLSTFASGIIGRDTPPGDYTLRITVVDRQTKEKAVLKRKFEVLKKTFGIVRVQAPAMGFAGQPYVIRFAVEGWQKDSKKLPNFSVGLAIYDEAGKPTLVKPITTYIPKDLPEEINPEELVELPIPVTFRLTRPGKFTIQLQATDRVSKKTIELAYKITVLDPKKYESAK